MANIDNELNKIKNAVYGKDVRGSIHDGIDKINKETESTTSKADGAVIQVDNIQGQVNQLVVDGDSSVEAAQARVDKDGEIYATLKDRLDTENNEVNQQLAQTEEQLKLSDLYDKFYGSLSIYNKPSTFPLEIPLQVEVSISGKVTHNYNIVENKNHVTTRYYVDVENGDNKNPGTEEQPFKTINRAFRHDPVDEIVIKSGVYGWSSGEGNSSWRWENHSFNIIGEGDVYLGAHRDEDEWVTVSGRSSVYTTNATNVTEIVDITDFESPIFYEQVNSIDQVENTINSYYIDGNDIYVRTNYVGSPNDKLLLNMGNYSALNLREQGKIYCENIKFTNTFTMDNGEFTGELYAKNCDYFIGSSENAFSVFGDVYFELQNCRAMYGERDGFNYHARNGKLPRGIEIDCYGAYNGRDGANQNNGSTMHDGGTILRIGGEYHNNYGPNVIDVNDGTKSLNIGVHAHHSTATSSLSNVDFRTRDDADMWLVNCVSHDSEYSTSTGSPARMYKENTLLLSEEVVI